MTGRRFMVVAILIAAALVTLANVIAAQLDEPLNWITAVSTSLVVGGFLALLLFGGRGGKADGFDVNAVREN